MQIKCYTGEEFSPTPSRDGNSPATPSVLECVNVNMSYHAISTEASLSMSSDRETMTFARFSVMEDRDMVAKKGINTTNARFIL